MRGAIPPLPQYAYMAWYLVKLQGQHVFLDDSVEVLFQKFQERADSRISFLTDMNS
jgi:hypothetical protein